MKISKYSDVRKIILYKWPKAKIKYIKEFPEGYNNLAYDVRLGSGDYVIKLLKIKGYENLTLKQNHICSLVRKKFKDFPIPKIIKSDFSKKLVRELRKEKIKAQCSAGYYLGETNYPEHTWVSVFVGDLRIEVEATGGYIIKDEDYESYEVKWEDLCW